MADNYNPTPQDLEALDALMRRALPLGEYHSFMDGVSLVYLHRVVQTARAEAQDEGAAGEPVAWRWRFVVRDGPLSWNFSEELVEEHPGPHPNFQRREVQPLYAHPSPTPAADPVSIVPPHCTGIALSFEPGVLHVSKDGSGYIAIDEKHFELEDDRCEGPDGPEGSLHWITRLDASEVVALRDFLNGAPPAADADGVRITDADAKWLTRWLSDQKEGGHCGEGNVERRERAIWNDRIDRILAALKSEGK